MKNIIRHIQLFAFILLLFIISSCGINDDRKIQSNSSPDEWEMGHNNLQDFVGDPKRSPNKIELALANINHNEDVIKHTEYSEPTGIWFLISDEGTFGYGLTGGIQKAGSEYHATLFEHSESGVTLNRDIRIQLTERDEDLNLKKLINEHVVYIEDVKKQLEIYSNVLPNKEQAIYFLSMEILDDHGDVEDTLVSVIYVSPEEMNARLALDKSVYQSSDSKARLTVHNLGPTVLSLGTYYTIEKKVGETWRIVPLDLVFNDIGIILDVNQTYDQTIDLHQLDSGIYRIVKDVHAEGLELSAICGIQFTIE